MVSDSKTKKTLSKNGSRFSQDLKARLERTPVPMDSVDIGHLFKDSIKACRGNRDSGRRESALQSVVPFPRRAKWMSNLLSGKVRLCLLFAGSLMEEWKLISNLAVRETERGDLSRDSHCRHLCCSPGPEICSLRYGLALIMHFSNFTMITQRVSLSIAIIAMVNSTQQPGLFNASTERPLEFTFNHSNRSIKEFNTRASVYEWSPETQGIIFSSINYGIILTLIPSGYLAGIFGAKQMLGAGLLISSLLTLSTPLAADFGVILVIVIRTIQGMAQGMAWTGQFTIWAKWAPPLERSKLTSIAGSGVAFGSFIILCVGGLISQALGWPFIFYIFGLLLPSLCAVALPFVASSYITTIILLILIPGTSNLCDSGFIINTLDIAPRYASFLMGISRGFGLIAGIISSTATGFLISQVGPVY
ncbi:Sodium-dependent phosphate transport protein 3 [Camelus dromedarius]|uniref:Sodium-dependent phosphate transport protein 3 n=1 Tax=Camelus dromedarius TaxID=9838 RepID=A0A5N4CQH0_CAMDR|nr:Sodium-dependent phosphate transport protein 3 [Camelus dromedarius]